MNTDGQRKRCSSFRLPIRLLVQRIAWYNIAMHIFFKRIAHLLESYIVIVVLAMALGLIFSKYVAFFSDYTQIMLAIICFLSALKMDLTTIESSLKDVKMLFVANALMLIVFPVVLYFLVRWIAPDFAIAFMMLAAMPSAMTSPLLSEVSGGRQGLALVLTASTSLLAPFTIPLVFYLLLGSTVSMDFGSMIWSLSKVMILPIVLAMAVRPMLIKPIKASMYAFKPISITLLGLLIMGIVGKEADPLLQAFHQGVFLWSLVGLFVLFIALYLIGYWATPWRDRADRMTMSVCLTYMNFTIAIFLAGKYFSSNPYVVVPVILSVIPWSLTVVPFAAMMKKIRKPGDRRRATRAGS